MIVALAAPTPIWPRENDIAYMKVAGRRRYVYRAVDQHGQIIDVLVSARRDLRAARRFFIRALRTHGEPVEVVTDRAPALRAAIEGLIPAAFHNTEQYANNRIECDHGRLKARLRPMRGLKRDHTARVIIRRRGRASVDRVTLQGQRNSAREVHQRREERGRRIMNEEFAAMLDAITFRRNRPVRAAC